MSAPTDTFTHANMTVKIFQDETPPNPREEFNNLGTMLCFHKRYNLGDSTSKSRLYKTVPKIDHGDYSSWAEMEAAIVRDHDAAVVLPLYLYDHSGITMSTGPHGCRFDSGQVGFIYCTKRTILNEYTVGGQPRKRLSKQVLQKVRECLESEVKTYDDYLTGNVYGFVVEDAQGEESASCWGFYGIEDAREAGKEQAGYSSTEELVGAAR